MPSAGFEMDREYVEECYSEWLRERSRLRRWGRQMGTVLCALGIVVFAATDWRVVGAALFLIGTTEWIDFYRYRSRWINRRLRAHQGGGLIKLEFDEEGFNVTGPTAWGRVRWEGVKAVQVTRAGMFLSIGEGQSIYIPKRRLIPEGSADEIARWARGS